LQYFALSAVAVLIGVLLSWLMRWHVAWPAARIPGLGWIAGAGAPNGVMTPEYYLGLLTMHGTLMVFFVLTLAPFTGFGSCFLPAQIGARRMAFPRCHRLSFWITFLSFCALLSAFFIPDGPPLSGWTAYAPLSAVGAAAGPGQGLGQTTWLVAIAILCVGQILNAVNFIATTLDYRAEGMTFWRMPLTAWAWFITSCIALLAFAVLLPACVLLLLDRSAGTSFFVASGLIIGERLMPHSGGSTLLWQHLFWFFGHPEVYIAILPAMGIVSHVLAAGLRRPLIGARTIVYSMIAIAFLGFIVWGHHMFVSGMNPQSAVLFSLPSMVISIPSAIITLIWIGSIYGGELRLNTSVLFSLGFISVFVVGGLSGFFLAQPALDGYLHATYFVVGHFHLIMGVAAVMAIFAGAYFWYPAATGRLMNERLGLAHFWVTFAGVYCIFMPFLYLGLAGNVRRYSSFVDDYMQPHLWLHKFITAVAIPVGAAQLLFFYNLLASWRRGKPASEECWRGESLEFSTPEVAVGNPVDAPASAPAASTGAWCFAFGMGMIFAALVSAVYVREGASNDWQHLQLPGLFYLSLLLLLAACGLLGFSRGSSARQNINLAAAAVCYVAFLALLLVSWKRLALDGITVQVTPNGAFAAVLLGFAALCAFTSLGALLASLVRKSEAALGGLRVYCYSCAALCIAVAGFMWAKL
jgi:cytochrome c oxidase subunit 1